MDCIFCKIINKEKQEKSVLFENERVLVMLDIDWATKGHVLVIWKKHAENCSDLSREEFSEFSQIVQKTEKILLEELKVNKAIILKSGGICSHFHFHIYPISKETSWEEIKNMFDKKVKHEATAEEKDNFVMQLKEKFKIDGK